MEGPSPHHYDHDQEHQGEDGHRDRHTGHQGFLAGQVAQVQTNVPGLILEFL